MRNKNYTFESQQFKTSYSNLHLISNLSDSISARSTQNPLYGSLVECSELSGLFRIMYGGSSIVDTMYVLFRSYAPGRLNGDSFAETATKPLLSYHVATCGQIITLRKDGTDRTYNQLDWKGHPYPSKNYYTKWIILA